MSRRLLPVDPSARIIPGSFEHALAHLVDHVLDLSAFEARFRDDAAGAAADPPGVLLKIVLLAHSNEITSCRAIEAARRQNVMFMAISGDTQPHCTSMRDIIRAILSSPVPVATCVAPQGARAAT